MPSKRTRMRQESKRKGRERKLKEKAEILHSAHVQTTKANILHLEKCTTCKNDLMSWIYIVQCTVSIRRAQVAYHGDAAAIILPTNLLIVSIWSLTDVPPIQSTDLRVGKPEKRPQMNLIDGVSNSVKHNRIPSVMSKQLLVCLPVLFIVL